ncbi:hypothetical protein RND81_09G244000 [Saponaria officinalis]|uniref:Uncharacterized protein n=1 Tax=Saponaria officinalis TaxID=3572 RepID=A0AAW1IRR8_SAPOF
MSNDHKKPRIEMSKPLPHYSGIPTQFLLQMGKYDIKVDGVKTIVHVIDCAAAVDKYIAEMHSCLECGPRVVGIDHKKLNPSESGYSSYNILVLYALGRCLIIHLYSVGIQGQAPESLDNFLSDSSICFVGTQLPGDSIYCCKFRHHNRAVKVGDLAARVLKKPEVTALTLAEVAREVGVSYKGPDSATAKIEVDSVSTVVLTEEQVLAALSDAFTYYQIGFKLLTSL